MTTNQTIDGVPREQLVRWEEMLRTPPGRQELLEELRALLDAPAKCEMCDGSGHLGMGLCECFDKPAAQPQGEPVAFTAVGVLRGDGEGGLVPEWILEGGTSELWAGAMLLIADEDQELCAEDGHCELYRAPVEQPAPVAVELGEPYAYEYEFATVLYSDGPGKFKKIITREAPDQHEADAGCIINVKPLYSAEPRKYDDTLLPFLTKNQE